MTISKLATSKYITDKHWEWRDESQIKYIIPHHMAGVSTGANCAKYFVNNGLENSANYCIGVGGDISCNVPEEYGAWTSSFYLADKYAVTIETSNSSTTDSDWPVSNQAKESLIQLMVDLIKRYPSLGGKAVFDPADEKTVVAARASYTNIRSNGNILLHNWTDPGRKICPGPYLTRIMPGICKEVNRRLAGGGTVTLFEEAQKMISKGINGKARIDTAKADGFDPAKVQAQIDLMLGKDKISILSNMAAVMPVIRNGSTGDAVKILQNELHRMGYYTGTIDGQCGPMTVAAIEALQANWNIVYGGFSVDGSFGPACAKRLCGG